MRERHQKPAKRPCGHKIYGLSCDEYELLRERADDRCEICGITAEESPYGVLHIDHYGGWGRNADVRGILCGRCNTCLYRDSVVSPEQRAAYLANAFYLTFPKDTHAEEISENTRRYHLERLADLGRRYRKAGNSPLLRQPLHDAIWDAHNAGVRQVDIAKANTFQREYIYVIVRKRTQQSA